MGKRLQQLSIAAAMLLLFFSYQNFDKIPNLQRTVELPLGLKSVDLRIPAGEKFDPAMIDLGNLLFFDKRLSKNGAMSCATCHQPDKGFSSNGMDKGVAGNTLVFKTPTALNRAFGQRQGWKGSKSLNEQSSAPFLAHDEMGLTQTELLNIVSNIPGYAERFQRLVDAGMLPRPGISKSNIEKVITAYQLSLFSGNSRVDRFEAGETNALSNFEKQGRALFHGQGRCILCHNGSNYSDEQFHNILSGCPVNSSAPCSRPAPNGVDGGRFQVTGNPADVGKFKTPSLRNVARHAPFFHRGHDATLKRVVTGYNNAGDLDHIIGQSPLLVNLGLVGWQEDAIVAFLNALNSEIPDTSTLLSTPAIAGTSPLRENILLSPDIFDADFYASQNGLTGQAPSTIQSHWLNNGISQGRQGSLRFSVTEYIEMYPEVANQFLASKNYLGAINYYIDHGRRLGHLGRKVLLPSFFDVADYRELNSNIQFLIFDKAIDHFLSTGLASGLAAKKAAKGFFSVNNNTYYHADGFDGYCRFNNYQHFKSHFNGDEVVGFSEFNAIPGSLTNNRGECNTVTLGPPDTVKPTLDWVSRPPYYNSVGSAMTWIYSASDDRSGIKSVRCRFDFDPFYTDVKGQWFDCPSTMTKSDLAKGTYLLNVLALDKEGNQRWNFHEFVVGDPTANDTTKPTITWVTKPPSQSTSKSRTWEFTASDAHSGVNRIECRLVTINGATTGYADWNVCESSVTLDNLPVGEFSFQIRVHDNFRNQRWAFHKIVVQAPPPITSINQCNEGYEWNDRESMCQLISFNSGSPMNCPAGYIYDARNDICYYNDPSINEGK